MSNQPGAVRIGRIAGADLLVRPSLLLMGIVLVFVFAPRFEDAELNSYVIAILFVIALYLSVLFHEAAHVLVARAHDAKVRSVTLHVLGGETAIEDASRTPLQELLTSISGPLASLALAGGAWAASEATSGVASEVLWSLAWLNLIVAAFNLLPGLPLDGGHVLKAIAWQLTGREAWGTRLAGWIGRVTAIAVVVFVIGFTRPINTDWAIHVVVALIVGWFLWSGASEALRHATLFAHVNRIDARTLAEPADAVPSDAPRLPADLYGARLLRAMTAVPADIYVLVENDGSVAGVLHADRVDSVFRSGV